MFSVWRHGWICGAGWDLYQVDDGHEASQKLSAAGIQKNFSRSIHIWMARILKLSLFGLNTHNRLVRDENIWPFALERITKLKNTFGDQREQSLVIQCRSKIGTSLDFEWSRRGWSANGLDLNSIWDLASQSFEIQTNSCHFGKKTFEIWTKMSWFWIVWFSNVQDWYV